MILSFILGCYVANRLRSRGLRRYISGIYETFFYRGRLAFYQYFFPRKYKDVSFKYCDGETSTLLMPENMEFYHGDHVILFINGGMGCGVQSYFESLLTEDFLQGKKYAIFHNPGVYGEKVKHCCTCLPAADWYLRAYAKHLRDQGIYVTVIGFSAGGTCAINSHSNIMEEESDSIFVCTVAIASPQNILATIERLSHAFQVYMTITTLETLRRCGSWEKLEIPLPEFFGETSGSKWLHLFVREYGRHMKQQLQNPYTARRLKSIVSKKDRDILTVKENSEIMTHGLASSIHDEKHVPYSSLIILSKNDPIVDVEVEMQFTGERWVYEYGGHMYVLAAHPEVKSRLRDWIDEKFEEYLKKKD